MYRPGNRRGIKKLNRREDHRRGITLRSWILFTDAVIVSFPLSTRSITSVPARNLILSRGSLSRYAPRRPTEPLIGPLRRDGRKEDGEKKMERDAKQRPRINRALEYALRVTPFESSRRTSAQTPDSTRVISRNLVISIQGRTHPLVPCRPAVLAFRSRE
jgi:hypothetical protein